jgi:uncharacterized protein HemY
MTLLGSIVYILQTVAVKLKITIYNYHYIVSFLSFYDCVVLVVLFVFVACVSGLFMFSWTIQRHRQHWAIKHGQSRDTGNIGQSNMDNPETQATLGACVSGLSMFD